MFSVVTKQWVRKKVRETVTMMVLLRIKLSDLQYFQYFCGHCSDTEKPKSYR